MYKSNSTEKVGCAIILLSAAVVVANLAIIGVLIWAVIKLVNHFAG